MIRIAPEKDCWGPGEGFNMIDGNTYNGKRVET
jgi:hypothetical protein